MSGLVGRVGELAALVGVFDGLGPVRASWVQVTGEPGIGKTRLVAEFCGIADARGATVVVGRGAELERDVAFGVVIDAFDDYLGSLDRDRLVELCGGQVGVLRRVFPALGGLGPRVGGGSNDERYPLYRALRVLVERLAVAGPLVVVLDDLHWADSASLELVSFLLRRPPASMVVMVLVWRPGQAPTLADAVLSSAKDWPGTTLDVTGLAAAEIGEMLGGTLDAGGLEALHRASGGNPFYAQALASSATPVGFGGWPGEEQEDAWSIPGAVVAAVRHEIDSLRLGARLLAQGGAVAGEPFDPGLAGRCADLGDDEMLDALDELVAAGIVHPAQSPRRFVFRHPIVRRAVYDSAGPGWRLGAHARAASVLSARGAPISATAHHIMRSGIAGDLGAAEVLIDAAAEVASRAPASAAAWLDAASAIVPRRPDTVGPRLALLTAQARVRSFLGDLHGAHDALREALGLVPAGDPRWVPLIAGVAGVEHGLGRFVEARARLLAALSELAGRGPEIEAVICVELAVSWLYTLDFAPASVWATRALTAAGGSDRCLEGTARALLAFVHASAETGDGNETARMHRAEAATILDGIGAEVMTRLDGLYYLGWTERLLEDYPAAAAHLGRAVTMAEAGGGSQWLVPSTIEHAKALACCGRITEARVLADTAVEMARVSQVGLLVLLALTALAGVLAAAGAIDAAVAAGTEALGLGSEGASYHAANVRCHLALAYLEAGDAERFGAELAEAETTGGGIVHDGLRCRLLEARSQAELIAGQTDLAGVLAGQAYEVAAALGVPASTGFALRARARALARSHPKEALAAARDAIAAFEEAGAATEAPRTKVLAGEVLAGCGRTGEAIAELSTARDILDAYGAHGSADYARRTLRRIRRAGPSPPRTGRPAFGLGALSRRQRAVAELVADGHTNRQIAARLSISENTVESHLSRILAKLEVTGRGAVARAMITPPPASETVNDSE